MKKILLPLTLSLIIVLALIFIAAPKKPAPAPVDPTAVENSGGSSEALDKLADETVKSETGTSAESSSGAVETAAKTESGNVTESTGSVTESGSSAMESICTDEYAPVCGTDGNTYPNACAAKRMKVESIPGACAKEGAAEDAEDAKPVGSVPASPAPAETAAMTGTGAAPTATVAGLAYDNAGLGYGFVLPKKTYFSGFWARDGAAHSVGIGRSASPESFELSEVKVRFYKNQILSQVKKTPKYYDSETGTTYVAVNGSTLTIDADASVSADIVDSIVKSAYAR